MRLQKKEFRGNSSAVLGKLNKSRGEAECGEGMKEMQEMEGLKKEEKLDETKTVIELTQQLRALVSEMCQHDNISSGLPSFSFQNSIIQVAKISHLCDQLSKSEAFSFLERGIKDRKTSFFRLILKHLKEKQKSRGGDEQDEKFHAYQKRLNMNSISSEKIQELFKFYGKKILRYIKSPKFKQDLIFKNKSRTNKMFYLLHLDSIIYAAEKGRAHEFPFFQIDPLIEQVRRVIRTLRMKFSQKKLEAHVKPNEEGNRNEANVDGKLQPFEQEQCVFVQPIFYLYPSFPDVAKKEEPAESWS